MTEQANPEIVRELAQAIFAVRPTGTRKLLRRLDAKGFTLAAKAG